MTVLITMTKCDRLLKKILIYRLEVLILKKRIITLILSVLTSACLCGCGDDPEINRFQQEMDAFCIEISNIDTAINSIDADSDDAVDTLLSNLDKLDVSFQDFAAIDFPEQFDYLEDIAKESSQYMTTAVESYHAAYSNDSYNEYTAEYAKENYSRAYKRVQIIISFLHGVVPEDVNITEESE